MNLKRLALLALVTSLSPVGGALAEVRGYPSARLASSRYVSEAPTLTDDTVATNTTDAAPADFGAACCDVAPGCDSPYGCDSLFTHDTSCALEFWQLFKKDCNPGDPKKLFPCGIGGWDVGGWTAIGLHSHETANSTNFDTYPGKVQLSQQWLYAEKIADGSKGFDIGGRIDYVYGTDAPDTNTFAVPGSWDEPWTNGSQYGHALPQLYVQVAMGDLSIMAGKFYTLIGNEVVQATGNFFYSRQFTFYNAEPFTHTGAVATYALSDDTSVSGGYVLGWDSGFDDNGDAFLGSISHAISDNLSISYATAMGRFNTRNGEDERGWIHSVILNASLTDKLSYINQTDVMYTRDGAGQSVRNTFGNIHYLIYDINDRWSFGQRAEWFNFGGSGFNDVHNEDMYNYTFGFNYRHNSNLTFRPEVRTVWDKQRYGFNENDSASQTSFGGDMVLTF